MKTNELKKHLVYLEKEYVEGEVYLVKDSFEANTERISSAWLYLTGFGMYDAYINGNKVGKQMFKPGYTYYNRRLLYQAYDVREMLEGRNTLTMYIGQGWYCGRFFCENTVQNYGKLPSFSYVLELVYENGEKAYVYSRPGQKALVSEYLYAGEYDGEYIDYSREDYLKEMGTLSSMPFPEGVELMKTLTEVNLQEEIEVKEVFDHGDHAIIDFGQNFAGVVSINIDLLKENEKIEIRHGEILNSDGSLYTANLRKAKASIHYKKKDEKGYYTPRFTYMGFRYIELKGAKYVDGLIKAKVLHTTMVRTGWFECENEMVNRLFTNQLFGQKSNYVEIPTDCPQRDERLGYTGDGHVFALTGSYNYDTRDFWDNFFTDLRLGQMDNPDGNVPPYLPQTGPKPVGFMSMQGWGSGVSIIPNVVYEQYGDTDFFVRQYEAIKKYVDMEIKKAGKKYLWKAISLGDWLSLHKGMAWQAMNNHAVSNAFFVNDLRLLMKLLRIMGKEEEYEYYKGILDKVKKAYIKAFIGKDGTVKKDYQGSYVMVLKHVLDEDDSELKESVRKRFIENVRKNGLDTGFFGTEHLLPMLIDAGETKMAYDILLSESCPGWLYQVKRGATTTWERWDAIREDGTVNEDKSGKDNMVSFNHYAFGSVGEFYYGYILGIRPLEPGYERIMIKPYPDSRLGNVKGRYLSRKGIINVSYNYLEGGKIRFEIAVPAPSVIILPNGDKYERSKGEYTFTIDGYE